MKAKNIFLIFCLVLSGTVHAQMLDTLSSLAVQGGLTAGSVQGVKKGLSLMQQNQVVQALNLMAMEIRTQYISGYNGLSKNDFQGSPFGALDWNVGPYGTGQFFIELKGLDQSSCQRLHDLMSQSTSKIIINQDNGSCGDQNRLMLVFD